jgi:hypothetical protein
MVEVKGKLLNKDTKDCFFKLSGDPIVGISLDFKKLSGILKSKD